METPNQSDHACRFYLVSATQNHVSTAAHGTVINRQSGEQNALDDSDFSESQKMGREGCLRSRNQSGLRVSFVPGRQPVAPHAFLVGYIKPPSSGQRVH